MQSAARPRSVSPNRAESCERHPSGQRPHLTYNLISHELVVHLSTSYTNRNRNPRSRPAIVGLNVFLLRRSSYFCPYLFRSLAMPSSQNGRSQKAAIGSGAGAGRATATRYDAGKVEKQIAAKKRRARRALGCRARAKRSGSRILTKPACAGRSQRDPAGSSRTGITNVAGASGNGATEHTQSACGVWE